MGFKLLNVRKMELRRSHVLALCGFIHGVHGVSCVPTRLVAPHVAKGTARNVSTVQAGSKSLREFSMLPDADSRLTILR